VVRTSQREICKGTRDLDREVLALRREEQKLILEIKAAAKTNNQAAMRVLAKSLVRLRSQIAKLQGSSANLRGVSTNLTTAAASTTVAQSMGTATAAMSKMQQQMNPAQVS
jgi:division protein CdvB (Snf7/Vps24/ESCRT-III family)